MSASRVGARRAEAAREYAAEVERGYAGEVEREHTAEADAGSGAGFRLQ